MQKRMETVADDRYAEVLDGLDVDKLTDEEVDSNCKFPCRLQAR